MLLRLLGIEWGLPGVPPSLYKTTERDNVLAALLPAVQVLQ